MTDRPRGAKEFQRLLHRRAAEIGKRSVIASTISITKQPNGNRSWSGQWPLLNDAERRTGRHRAWIRFESSNLAGGVESTFMSAHLWDQLSGKFGDDIDDDAIPADAADNILIAWPPILGFVEEHVRPPAHVIDFGCGGGRLVAEMNRRGYKATGIDPSPKMIESARSTFGGVSFYVGSADDVASLGPVDAVTSVMALQFVEEIEMTLGLLAASLNPHGVLAFAVHNPDFVADGMKRARYPEFVETRNGRRTSLTFARRVTVPLFIRTADEYDRMTTKGGLQRTFHAEPPFTQEFIEQYGGYGDNPYSEYLILGYQKFE